MCTSVAQPVSRNGTECAAGASGKIDNKFSRIRKGTALHRANQAEAVALLILTSSFDVASGFALFRARSTGLVECCFRTPVPSAALARAHRGGVRVQGLQGGHALEC